MEISTEKVSDDDLHCMLPVLQNYSFSFTQFIRASYTELGNATLKLRMPEKLRRQATGW